MSPLLLMQMTSGLLIEVPGFPPPAGVARVSVLPLGAARVATLPAGAGRISTPRAGTVRLEGS